jgi:hypothetical protein
MYMTRTPSERADFVTWLYNLICFLLIIGLFLVIEHNKPSGSASDMMLLNGLIQHLVLA